MLEGRWGELVKIRNMRELGRISENQEHEKEVPSAQPLPHARHHTYFVVCLQKKRHYHPRFAGDEIEPESTSLKVTRLGD